ncbi:hypothetical protein Dsin_026193 [Dipteronia sinensis]|uniref:Cytochrome P450 n=1 Tax=Dipteronia sinensis TaxID=43782 RepID=A0AAE0DXT3_9ROSI|nr:hypothetical protein Dsin_026193 [Dipteronia sinensis]
MWEVGAICLVALLLLDEPKCKNGKLPPGSMGVPFIGETLQFFSPYPSHDIPPFIKNRIARYGPLFRTSLVGQKIVVSADNEINYSIFQQEDKSFQLWYTDSFAELIGREKNRKLLVDVDQTTRRHLQSWAEHGSVDFKQGASQVIFEFLARNLMSYDEKRDSKKVLDNCKTFMDGLISFPLNIPGTVFHASLQGRKKIVKVIEDILQDRRASKVPAHDFLDHLLEEMKNEDTLINDNVAINLIFALFFASHESTSQAVALLVNFVSDHPDVLAELTKEHETILRGRDNENTGITWEEYKSMTFTHMVINESVRIGSITPGLFRKVVQDVEINGKNLFLAGYTIPAGWTVLIIPSAVHFNPEKYDNPYTFNPWRWQGQELHKGSKSFMGFGCGVRLCVGAEFAKLQMATFLHYLVTKYRKKINENYNIGGEANL